MYLRIIADPLLKGVVFYTTIYNMIPAYAITPAFFYNYFFDKVGVKIDCRFSPYCCKMRIVCKQFTLVTRYYLVPLTDFSVLYASLYCNGSHLWNNVNKKRLRSIWRISQFFHVCRTQIVLKPLYLQLLQAPKTAVTRHHSDVLQ